MCGQTKKKPQKPIRIVSVLATTEKNKALPKYKSEALLLHFNYSHPVAFLIIEEYTNFSQTQHLMMLL